MRRLPYGRELHGADVTLLADQRRHDVRGMPLVERLSNRHTELQQQHVCSITTSGSGSIDRNFTSTVGARNPVATVTRCRARLTVLSAGAAPVGDGLARTARLTAWDIGMSTR